MHPEPPGNTITYHAINTEEAAKILNLHPDCYERQIDGLDWARKFMKDFEKKNKKRD